jgi:hypothetical protein
MNAFHIEAQEFTPLIQYTENDHTLTISGMSVPEDTMMFYAPALQWLDGFIERNQAIPFTVVIKLIYFNTSSSKVIYDILSKLEKSKKNFNPLRIVWYYNEEDDYMFEAGTNFSELVNLPFEFISFE